MSLQIFLHGKIPGIEEFLRNASADLAGRAQWATLLSEVIPRALLAEFGLSGVLLGSSGGGQFLLVLPQEVRAGAEEFCRRASADLSARSGGILSLVWSVTENLGSWPDIRSRLSREMHAREGAQGWIGDSVDTAQPELFLQGFREGSEVGWAGDVVTGGDGPRWTLGRDIPFAHHAAPDDEGERPASLDTLASRADGRWLWGVLRGDVDDFTARLRRALTVEEHIQLSLMYKQFFIGELQMRCSLPEYWRKVTLLTADGQDFAVAGAWDALIGLAREVQRLFALFAEATLKEFAGPEGRTISMAISLAEDPDASPAEVFADAGDKLQIAKSAGRDSIWLLGRTLEWKQLADAANSRETMVRLIREFGVPRQLLDELAGLYRESPEAVFVPGGRRANVRLERPWRFYRRLNATLGAQPRGKDFQRLRSDLIADFTGRRASNVRLRPQGRVALEWASLETEAV